MDQLHLLAPLKNAWLEKIKLGCDFKEEQFGKNAKIAMKFFSGTNKDIWDNSFAKGPNGFMGEGARMPTFKMVLNKVSEFVQLFGPSVYPKDPHRDVLPKEQSQLDPSALGDMNDPFFAQQVMMLQQQEAAEFAQKKNISGILQDCLNYTPRELSLRKHVRRAIDECIVKGMGVLWSELYQPYGSTRKLVGSFYDSVDNLVIDPDAETIEEAKWIARKCCHPYWEVEREYGYPADSLKKYAQRESATHQGETSADLDDKDNRNRGATSNDLLIYWKVYSKMGMGSRLSGFGKSKDGKVTEYAALNDIFEQAGDYCYLVVCDSCPYPLNLPPAVVTQEFEDQIDPMAGTVISAEDQALAAITEAVQWPIPYWADDSWPFEPIIFHEKPGYLYPDSHLKPGMGQLMFLNWAMSFLAEKVANGSTTLVGITKFKREDIVDAFSKACGGYAFIPLEELSGAKSVAELMNFQDPPAINFDLYRMVDEVAASFDKAVGLSEILYGNATTQSRSATDAQVRQSNATIRIDDMRQRVAETMERIARKEAMALRWLLTPEDILPIVGQTRAQMAAQTLFTQDVESVVREYDYTILSSELSPRNKMVEQQNLSNAISIFLPVLAPFAQMGQVGPLNSIIEHWGKAFNLDTTGMMVMPPPPPPMMGPPPEQAA